jgi:hypothetical protein
VRHIAEGLMRRDTATSPAYCVFPAPVEVGTTLVDGSVTLIVVSVTDTVNVTVGSFTDCVVVDEIDTVSGGPDETYTSWYARDIGMVKQEHHTGPDLADSEELIAYSVN